MAATVALVILLVLVFGGMMLALGYGYLTTERERERERMAAGDEQPAAARVPAPAMGIPDFLSPARVVPRPVAFLVDEAFVSRLEDHVRAEQAFAAQFVHHPSIDSLYRHSGAPLHVH